MVSGGKTRICRHRLDIVMVVVLMGCIHDDLIVSFNSFHIVALLGISNKGNVSEICNADYLASEIGERSAGPGISADGWDKKENE